MAQRSINQVTILGNLTRDAEQRFTPSGSSVTKFSIATSRRYKQGEEWKDEVNFSNVVVWGQEALAQYLQKGKQVFVQGRNRNYSYEDKQGNKVYAHEIVADEVILLGGKSESAGGTNERGDSPYERNKREFTQATGGAKDPYEGMGVTDADIPF